MTEILYRFLVGGVVVSVFAVIGELFDPKRFSGIFAAAPSVAIATLGLTFVQRGGHTVATEGWWMLIGAVAMLVNGAMTALLVQRKHFPMWIATAAAWGSWLVVALTGWVVLHEELLA